MLPISVRMPQKFLADFCPSFLIATDLTSWKLWRIESCNEKSSYFVLSLQNLTNHSTIWLAQISTTDPNTVDFHCLAFYFEVLRKQHSPFQFCQWNDPHWLHCWQFKLTRIHWRFGSFQEIVLKGSTISGTWLVNCDGPLCNLPFLRLMPSTSTMWSNVIWPSMVPNILGCTGSRSNGSKPPATAVGKLWRW